MPRPDTLLIIATLLPLASFTLLVFVGKRMGKPLAGIVGTTAIALSFLCSILAMMSWVSGGQYVPPGESAPMSWVPAGYADGKTTFLKVGIYVDSLTIVMFAMITLVASLVHVFSLAYM